MTERRPDPRAVARRFGRAAASYEAVAGVQRQVCARLAELAAAHPPAAGPLLDAGCGTGQGLALLAGLHPQRCVLGLDLAPPMLARLRERRPAQPCIAADVHALPLAAGSLGGIWSSLCLQWCEAGAVLAEFARVLAPGGVAWLATLGPATFHELRTAFAGIDDAAHVLDCEPPEQLVRSAAGAGLSLQAEERHRFEAAAGDLAGLLRDIKALGAQGVSGPRRRGLLGKQAWRTVEARYEAHRRADGRVAVSYDALFLILRKRP